MKRQPKVYIRDSVLYFYDDFCDNSVYLDQLESETFGDSIEREKSIVVQSLERDIWIDVNYGARKVSTWLNVSMTLRAEKRGQLIHWYAYRRIGGKLRKYYAGHSEEINTGKIVELARKFEVI